MDSSNGRRTAASWPGSPKGVEVRVRLCLLLGKGSLKGQFLPLYLIHHPMGGRCSSPRGTGNRSLLGLAFMTGGSTVRENLLDINTYTRAVQWNLLDKHPDQICAVESSRLKHLDQSCPMVPSRLKHVD